MSLVTTSDALASSSSEPLAVEVAPAPAPEAPAVDLKPLVAEARAHLETALQAELRHIEEAVSARIQQTEARLAQAQAQVEALRKANAEAERRLAVLNEVKRSLERL